MKPSPLRLKWVAYPAATYSQIDGFAGQSLPTLPIVEAAVTWCRDAEHAVSVRVRSPAEHPGGYNFDLNVAAIFTFDLELAQAEYRSQGLKLAGFIATNIVRIIYAGAREHLAMMTARGPYGPAMLDSQLLEPKDVNINSDEQPEVILREIFKLSDEAIKALTENPSSKPDVAATLTDPNSPIRA